MQAGATRRAYNPVALALLRPVLGPEKRLADPQHMPGHRAVPHVGQRIDGLAVAEPVALDPIDMLDPRLRRSGSGKQHKAIEAERRGEGTNPPLNGGQGSLVVHRQRRLESALRDLVAHRAATSASSVSAASLPRLLEASGLSPVSRRRSLCTLPVMSALTILTPSSRRRSPTSQGIGPGM